MTIIKNLNKEATVLKMGRYSFRYLVVGFLFALMAMMLLNQVVNQTVLYLEHGEIAKRVTYSAKKNDMYKIIGLQGFASREMAHQVLADEATIKEQIGDAFEKRKLLVDELDSFIAKNQFSAEESELVNELKSKVQKFSDDFDQVMSHAKVNNDVEALKIVDASEEEEDTLIELSNKYVALMQAAFDLHNANVQRYKFIGQLCAALLTLVSGMLALSMYQILKGRMSTISNSVLQVNNSYNEVTNNITKVSHTVDQESHSIHEIVQAVTEFGKTVAHITQRCESTAQNTDDIKKKVGHALGNMEHLKAVSREIGDVLKLIEDIAEQTNLLALNAAIEAARAGDAGRGFAVVADEVRKLAHHTTESTEQIRTSIKGLAGEVSNLGCTLGEVQTSIVEIDAQAEEISSATHQQHASMGQINEAVQRFSNSMIDIGTSMNNAHDTNTQLGNACNHLMKQVARA